VTSDASLGHRCSVLVADDDADVRELLRVTLAAEGYHVEVAANGRDALDHLRSTPETCMILLDLNMPVMDGAQFRAAQLRDRALAWIPVVILSAIDDGPQKSRELAARSFVPKPIDLEVVRRVVQRVGCVRAKPRQHMGR
jgi:CheY-like chemotaxis protein